MIPLYKLEKLPRTQKLRKIAKVFSMADARLCTALSGADESLKNGVTHNKRNPRWNMREDFSPSSASRLCSALSGASEKKAPKIFTAAEFVFFSDAANLLKHDALFSDNARLVFGEAAVVFKEALQTSDVSDYEIRRALNNIKHLLLTETGRDQADWDFTAYNGKLDSAKRCVFEGMQVYLEDIRSPFNVGAMFRTAESFGVEKIILSPFCADPHHRRAERTAMGCIDIVPWEREDLFADPDHLPDSEAIFALETGGTPLDEFPFPRRALMIAGSEELGVSPRALAAADASLGRVSIPSFGAKASLNVSVAFGIALQKWAAVCAGVDNAPRSDAAS